MDVARLNFSHGDEDFHRQGVANVRAAAAAAGRHIALLQDLQGPKIRTGALEEPFVRLRRGRLVRLTAAHVRGDAERVPVSHRELIEAL